MNPIQKWLDRGWVLFHYKQSIPSLLCIVFLFLIHPTNWKVPEDWVISSIALFACFRNPTPLFFYLFIFFLFSSFLEKKSRCLLILFFLCSSAFLKTGYLFWILFITWSSFFLFQPIQSILPSFETILVTTYLQYFHFSVLSIFLGL